MKGIAITKFIVTSVLVVLGLFLSIFSFDIGIYTYNGFAKSIKLGIDLEGGVLAVYNVKNIDDNETNFDTQVQATITRISDLLTSKGFSEATVVKQGNGLNSTQIRVEVPDVDDPEEICINSHSQHPAAELYLGGQYHHPEHYQWLWYGGYGRLFRCHQTEQSGNHFLYDHWKRHVQLYCAKSGRRKA